MHIGQMIIRIIQFVWILLITALIGNVLAGKSETSSTVNYSMFVAAFCWIVWFFGIAAVFVESLAIPIVLGILDLASVIFTFVAGVVLAKKLNGAHSCNNEDYVRTNSITRGGNSPTKRCRELQASCAFFWFLFAAFIASLVITSMQGFGKGMQIRNRHKGQKQNMSQVQA